MQLITDKEFAPYGKVLSGSIDVSQMMEVMEKTDAPADDVVYVPSFDRLEALSTAKEIQNSLFGGLKMQLGYCNGTNYKLNAVEYHRCSEFGLAVSDLILLLGRQQDIGADYTYDSAKIEAFFVPKGSLFELYATTLHYAPCSAGANPFRCVIMLPEGTNTELTERADSTPEDKLMTAKNKWLIAHEEAGIENAFIGIKGENNSV